MIESFLLAYADALLPLLVALPVAGAACFLSRRTPRRRDRLFAASGLVAAAACVATLALVAYRRYELPMGATQLVVRAGEWFSVPPLEVTFTLRMDTAAAIACAVVAAFALGTQIVQYARRQDSRLLGAYSLATAAILLFVLADNLVPVAAALVLTGPLAAGIALTRHTDRPVSERIVFPLFVHGVGDGLVLFGLFFVYAAFGAFDYRAISEQMADAPAAPAQAVAGVLLLLAGAGMRSAPGLFESVLPLLGAGYLGMRLWPVAGRIPRPLLIAGGALIVAFAIANLAHAIGTLKGLYDLTARARQLGRVIFAELIDEGFFQTVTQRVPNAVERAAALLARRAATVPGATAAIVGIAAVAIAVYAMVRA